MEMEQKIKLLKEKRKKARQELSDRRIIVDLAKLSLKSQPWHEASVLREEKDLSSKEELFKLADILTTEVLKDMGDEP